jgi:hypothetical protein
VLPFPVPRDVELPGVDVLPDEELAVALCQPNCLDRPQILRLAAQIVSRGSVDVNRLCLVAVRERAEPVLAELSRQALIVEPAHAGWGAVHEAFAGQAGLRAPILHWSRLAQPIMAGGKCNAERWELVA